MAKHYLSSKSNIPSDLESLRKIRDARLAELFATAASLGLTRAEAQAMRDRLMATARRVRQRKLTPADGHAAVGVIVLEAIVSRPVARLAVAA
jgi:hypothetical protein